MIAALTLLVVVACLVRMLLEGTMRVLKSPLTLAGMLWPWPWRSCNWHRLPARLAARLSPRSRRPYALGFFPDRVHGPTTPA